MNRVCFLFYEFNKSQKTSVILNIFAHWGKISKVLETPRFIRNDFFSRFVMRAFVLLILRNR